MLRTLCGLMAGAAAAFFLHALNEATELRMQHPWIILGLPIAGLLIGVLFYRFGERVERGNNLVLDEIHEPQKTLPLAMAPLIFLGTILTHLFGGSAGREGTAVQMGASLSDQISRFWRISDGERKILLMAGMGAGFGAAIGAPWAGAIFGIEVLRIGGLRLSGFAQCLLASFVGYGTAVLLKAPHSVFPSVDVPALEPMILVWAGAAGILFGLTARFFTTSTHACERLVERWIPRAPLRPLFGGCFLLVMFSLEGSLRYAGLGIGDIQNALQLPASFADPFLKSLFTTVTLATGFKGGEFVPLVYMGTTLGSALSAVIPLSVGLLAALGFAAVFGGAANTPLACAVMAMEIFGWRIGAYALVSCFLSYSVSSHQGIYRAQRLHHRKPLRRWLKHLESRCR